MKRLAVFGSAVGNGFDPEHSDLDFLVEFLPLEPVAYAEAYFGLLAALETLFGVAIDLVEAAPIANPFFRQEIEETQVLIYAAA